MIVAARHTDDAFEGPRSLEHHRQRGRLLRSLVAAEAVGQAHFSEGVDAEDYARETGHALIDVPVALAVFASSIAAVVSVWISTRPRAEKDSVPGVRLELPGKTLIVSSKIKKKERRWLVRAFLDPRRD